MLLSWTYLKRCKNKGNNNGPFDEDKIDDIVIKRLGVVAQTNLNNCCSLFIKVCNSLRKKVSFTESSAAAATAK